MNEAVTVSVNQNHTPGVVVRVPDFGIARGEDGLSAYEQAVIGGYTGTEAQFNEELSSFKTLHDETETAAAAAAQSATSAGQSATAAAGSSENAASSATSAASSAYGAYVSAGSAADSASSAASSAATAAASAASAGNSASTATEKASEAASSATAASTSATSAQGSASNAESSATAASASATAAGAAQTAAETAASHYPQITNGYWYVWDVSTGAYVNTNVKAVGEDGVPGQPGRDGQDGAPGQPGRDGATGPAGKSAYESAQDGGYSKTEAQFEIDLADVGNKQSRITASGLLKGDGEGGVSAATPGTDYVPPIDYAPDSKTAAMTQPVGKDTSGKLWTEPGGVTDVQVAGTSIVQGGVANIPAASTTTPGVIQIDGQNATGLQILNEKLQIAPAADSDIKDGLGSYKPIVPNTQHKAAFYGLAKAAGDTTQSTSSDPVGQYTESAKSAIKSMLGAAGSFVKAVDLTLTADVTHPNGVICSLPEKTTHVFIFVDIKASTDTTTLTVKLYNSAGTAFLSNNYGGQISTTEKFMLLEYVLVDDYIIVNYNTDNSNSQIRRGFGTLNTSQLHDMIDQIRFAPYSGPAYIPAGSKFVIFAC